jgi:hypothetical protein
MRKAKIDKTNKTTDKMFINKSLLFFKEMHPLKS